MEFVACAVVVAEGLGAALGDFDGHEGGYAGWVEVVECGVDVPAVEAREVEVFVRGDSGLVEGFVVRMFEGDVGEAFV